MLSDHVLSHLRTIIDFPDLSGTRYRVVEEIGRGGMGVVYQAYDEVLERTVALKVLNGPREARTLASLEYPGIVPVHDTGVLPDGRAFYAMKLVQGTRLARYRAAAPSISDRLRTFLRICEPIAFAHSRGVIHRDLKPENLMIGDFGEVLVLDWGIARPAASVGIPAAGTHGYMAPEQWAGITDERTDIYSLGKVLEYLLNSTSPRPVRAMATKAAAPQATSRYSSVTELMEDVARFLDGQSVSAYRESPFERAARLLARNRTIVGLILTYVLVRAAIIFFSGR